MSFHKKVLDFLREKQAIRTDKIEKLKGVTVAFHAQHFFSTISLSPKCFLLSDNQWFQSEARKKIQKLT